MIKPGLVSISFRKLPVERLIELVVECRLACIEWGGDLHVPHGDTATAARVAERMKQNGLFTAAYGSYYRAGEPEQPDFAAVADTAAALETGVIRVWAGARGSDEVDEAQRSRVTADLARAVALAAKRNIVVATEYHGNTLTDTPESAARLLTETPGLQSCWQPAVPLDVAARAESLREILLRLANLHVFQWLGRERQPLEAGRADWRRYLKIAAEAPGDRAALLEFFRDDAEAQMRADAAVLRGLLDGTA